MKLFLLTLVTLVGLASYGQEKETNNSKQLISYYANGNKRVDIQIAERTSIPHCFFEDTASCDIYVDVITGKQTNYYENGKKKSEGFIVNSMRSGYWLFYDEKGEAERSEFYKCLTKAE